MSRPNEGKTQKSKAYPRIIVNPKMLLLLKAFRLYLIQDGHPNLMDASIADISNIFVDHYMGETLGSSSMNRVKKNYSSIKNH